MDIMKKNISKHKSINYLVRITPSNQFGKSLHCQLCGAIVFPLNLAKCKCTDEQRKKFKKFK
jgi:hypothetical protein